MCPLGATLWNLPPRLPPLPGLAPWAGGAVGGWAASQGTGFTLVPVGAGEQTSLLRGSRPCPLVCGLQEQGGGGGEAGRPGPPPSGPRQALHFPPLFGPQLGRGRGVTRGLGEEIAIGGNTRGVRQA